jgi:hypothetical protein
MAQWWSTCIAPMKFDPRTTKITQKELGMSQMGCGCIQRGMVRILPQISGCYCSVQTSYISPLAYPF